MRAPVPDALDPVPAKPAIDGSSAAAILLMLLDESEAATILKHLGPDEVKGLAKAMYDTANATKSQIEQALDSFVARSRSVSQEDRTEGKGGVSTCRPRWSPYEKK